MENSLEAYQPLPEFIKRGTIRKVYSFVPLDPDEEEALSKFRAFATKKRIQIPPGVDDQHRMALKFMDSAKRKPKKAFKIMEKYLSWLNTELPVPINEVSSMIDQGFMYLLGRDRKFHPIMIISVRKMLDCNIDLNSSLRLNYFLLTWALEHMMVPGKVETWTIIMDLADVSATQLPIMLLKNMLKKLSINFMCRLEKSFIINLPSALNTVYKMLKPFIDEDTKKKIVIQKDGWEPLLREDISEEVLEEKYGGARPNITSGFFPPAFY
ncbi:unnamed protein product [Blepharisma stoltei]|uniref:CRAL-TRIO domain-containing protein n=1 Tax=Blepharisma stoltei TaxID=1481888 RepID=A0AAU9IA91_9CILI|nr:unnamed protein product [Blepharisma stoltei]